uniref:SET domain-containing protein n=1 Tax=Panagrolaimus sp. ES5 TaxID=591445 RepID=A0AC34G248_9BILA
MSNDAEVWRQKANECFKNENYDTALNLYNRAIKCDPELPVLNLNISLTCLKLESFYDAYEAAKLGLEKNGDREKALYRMGQAAYGMQKFEESANLFVEVVKKFPGNVTAREQLKRTMARLAEQRHGKFNFKAMYLESKKEKPELDVADYIGPIKVENIPGKGRGIIATKDIKEGTLLAVSKAYASGSSQDFSGVMIAVDRKRAYSCAQIMQVFKTTEKLSKNPNDAKKLYDLSQGDVDMDSEKEEVPYGVIDVAKIFRISKCNQFADKEDQRKSELSGKNTNCYLFILPSYFNHSCMANAHRTFYDDVMVLHAVGDIKKGEEICLSYFPPSNKYSERKNRCENWNFICCCKLCEVDSNDAFCESRDEMVNEFSQYASANLNSLPKVIVKGELLLKKVVRETYSKRNELYTKLAELLISLAKIYFKNGNSTKSIEYFEEAINIMEKGSFTYFIQIAEVYATLQASYLSVGNMIKAAKIEEKAIKLNFCEDFEHYQMILFGKPNCNK